MSRPWRIGAGYYTFRFKTIDLIVEGIVKNDKCKACNRNATFWYELARTESSGKELIKQDLGGSCGNCYSDMLAGINL